MQSYFRCVIGMLVCIWVLSVGCTAKTKCTSNSECEPKYYCKILEGECAQDCAAPIDCKSEETCDERGKCVPKNKTCTSQSEKRCVSGKVVWYDSCGFQQDLVEDCGAAGCENGACKREAIRCGDAQCQVGEDCVSCAGDCPCASGQICDSASATCKDSSSCGDGTCNSAQNETCVSCPADCKCAGDQLCDPQTSTCTASQALCGNGTCDAAKGENCSTCAKDCQCAGGQQCSNGSCQTSNPCGDGNCDSSKGENCSSCGQDCKCGNGEQCNGGVCKPALRCGDGQCDASQGENCSTCAQDCKCNSGQHCDAGSCQVSCGDGKCEASRSETCNTCPQDCKCSSNAVCQSGQCVNCSCTPSERRCSGNSVEQCKSDCTGWTTVKNCLSGQQCRNGSCEATCGNGRCDSGENCSTCASDCKCSSSQKCQSGSCVSCACTAKAIRCSGLRLEECKADCSGWSLKELCDSAEKQFCNVLFRSCSCLSASGCNSTNYFNYRCTSSGEREYCSRSTKGCYYWRKSLSQCTSPQVCSDGKCCACKVGDKRCNGRMLQQCNTSCTGWSDVKECKFDDYLYCSTLSKDCKCFTSSTCTSSTLSTYRCLGTERQFCIRNSAGCYQWIKSALPCTGTKKCVNGYCQ